MDAQILKVVGQVAGIGGIALAVVLLLFREVIRKNLFPNLSREQGYHLIRLVVILTFTIGAFGIAAWVYVQPQAGKGNTSPETVEQKIEGGGTGIIQTGPGQIAITNTNGAPAGSSKDQTSKPAP